jgi:hypothetical protein
MVLVKFLHEDSASATKNGKGSFPKPSTERSCKLCLDSPLLSYFTIIMDMDSSNVMLFTSHESFIPCEMVTNVQSPGEYMHSLTSYFTFTIFEESVGEFT